MANWIENPDEFPKRIAFDFENYQTIHPFKIKNSRDFNDEIISSIMFFSLERPADLTEIAYRLVIDGLWTPDPVNTNNYYDAETGVSLSKVEIGSTLPVVTGTNSESITRFIYNGESGKTVRIGGTFTNWDSWIYELEETSPGFYEISIPLPQGKYYYNYFLGMKAITDKTNPEKAVTFVDNHDTEPGQALESWVLDWFKPLAYSLTLLRKDGFPCVFYGDYYGIPEKGISSKNDILKTLLKVRKYYAHGEQYDYFNDRNLIGFTRLGDYEHHDSGLAVVMSDGRGGGIQMNVGKHLANTVLYDCTGNLSETVYVDNDGNGIFYCKDGSVSVWIKQGQAVNRIFTAVFLSFPSPPLSPGRVFLSFSSGHSHGIINKTA